MDPAEPTTPVWHGYYGDLRVVSAPGMIEAQAIAERSERLYGPGTWCIREAVHQDALKAVAEGKQPTVASADFRWCPWNQLRRRQVDGE